MDSPVSPKDEIWFLRVCHQISTGLYSQPVLRYSSLRGRTVSHYRRVIRYACDCVGNKALSYIGDPRILNEQYFYWNFPMFHSIVLPLILVVQMNARVKHWWSHTDGVKAKYSERNKYRCDFFQLKSQNIWSGIELEPQNGVPAT